MASDPVDPSAKPPAQAPPAKSKRRPRYRGTHPRRFEERYKERDPERYREEAEKVRAQGRTPAGAHVPIMVAEILEALALAPGARGADATLGYGGHAAEVLRRTEPQGFLWAFDRDAFERPKAEARLRGLGFSRFEAIASPFGQAEARLRDRGADSLDFVLADLGVSSMQLDDPSRGFSRKRSGPLDMRMSASDGETAAEWLARSSEEEIASALRENSDEPRAERLARALCQWRAKRPLRTTLDFAAALEAETARWPKPTREREGDGPIVRAFQAVRIEVNREFEELDALLASLPRILKAGGRAAILSFHSGEDRRVKKAFQEGVRAGVWREVAPDPTRASPEEIRANPRARSAKLRWAVRG